MAGAHLGFTTMECAGRAKRRRRFGSSMRTHHTRCGVALRLPPTPGLSYVRVWWYCRDAPFSYYKGTVPLEKPFFAQGGAASGGAGLVWSCSPQTPIISRS